MAISINEVFDLAEATAEEAKGLMLGKSFNFAKQDISVRVEDPRDPDYTCEILRLNKNGTLTVAGGGKISLNELASWEVLEIAAEIGIRTGEKNEKHI